jgi:CheY-like chemotaxis protein
MINSILHVQDDPSHAKLVKTAFNSFGFSGEMLSATSVHEALVTLDERARLQKPLKLVLTDMQLPDGTGLDVIRAVKSSPDWRSTPVVVLSDERSSKVVADIYAIGADCFMPKTPKRQSILSILRSLYDCWLDTAVFPEESPSKNDLQAILARSIRIRARQADVYMILSQAFVEDPPQSEFWLDRALNEGNLSNIFVFFQRTLDDYDNPFPDAERLVQVQSRTNEALQAAEQFLQEKPLPTVDDCLAKVLDILEAADINTLTEFIRHILPRNPVAARALKSAMVDHFIKMAFFIGERAELPSLCGRATGLIAVANKLNATHPS